MRLLLDTHILLWWLGDSAELAGRARELIAAPENLVVYSSASLWEIRIKEGLGKLQLPPSFSGILEQQPFAALAVTVRHTEALQDLPMHHRDPFDRMLVAQARVETLTLLTHDKALAMYDVPCHLLV